MVFVYLNFITLLVLNELVDLSKILHFDHNAVFHFATPQVFPFTLLHVLWKDYVQRIIDIHAATETAIEFQTQALGSAFEKHPLQRIE